MFYRLDANNKIIDNANFKYADDCLETDKNIIRSFDGKLVFEEETKTEEYLKAKAVADNKVKTASQIEEKKVRLEELRKDIVQSVSGLIIEDIEQRKAEYRTLLNEVRILLGKEPRKIKEEV